MIATIRDLCAAAVNFFSNSCCSVVLSVLLLVLTAVSLLQLIFLHLYNFFRNMFTFSFVLYSLPFLWHTFQHCTMLHLTNVFTKVNGRSTVLFEQLILSQLVDNFPCFEPRCSLLHTKRPAFGPYTHHDEPNQCTPKTGCEIYNTIFVFLISSKFTASIMKIMFGILK